MAFSGGTFSRTFDCTTDRDNGVKILASKFDTELDGMAVGLSTAILKDGTQTCTAAIPFAQGITLPDDKTIAFGTNSDVLIQYDETTTDSLKISAAEGAGLAITLMADEGDDAGDEWKLNIADGGTLTLGNDINSAGTYVTHLTITPNATVANSTMAVAGNLTVGGALTLGSGAVISEAELETIDGITPGTVLASKAMIVDSDKDITGGRNLTITGELDAATLDISGNADIDGTLETDALSIASTLITATGAELNYNDTGAAVGTVVASKTVTVDANKDVASFRNITLTGELDAGSLDVSGNADIDGTLEADAITLNGTAITTVATLSTGISNGNLPVFTSGAADNDFLRIDGTAIEGRSASEVLSDIAAAPAAGSSNIVTTGALNSGSITSGFGAINNGSSAITTTGTVTYGSLSDGSITITAFVDEDDMSSDSATLVPTQQSVKAYVDNNAGGMSGWVLEDDDGTEVNITDAKEVKIIGSGVTTNWTDTSHGSDGDPYDFTISIDAAQTTITSLFATDIKIGEDDETKIDFGTANEIRFKSGNVERLRLDSTGIIFNEDGIDQDFRVESNSNTNAFFVNGATGKCSMGPDGEHGGANVSTLDLSATGNAALGVGRSDSDLGSCVRFFKVDSSNVGTIVGSINVASSSTAYNTSSDYRLKTSVSYDWDATTRLKQLKPARFKWIADGESAEFVDGFLAHEAATVVPEAVSGDKDAVDADGNIDPQGIDQAKLVPLLVKTILELEARIAALEAG